MMERRVLLAIFLAFLVLYVWQALFVKPVPKPASGTTVATGATTAASPVLAEPPAAPARVAEPARPPQPSATALVATTSERHVRIETRDVIAVFTCRRADWDAVPAIQSADAG